MKIQVSLIILLAIFVIMCILSVSYLNIYLLCSQIKTNPEQALETIRITNNVNQYSAPILFRGFLNACEFDLQLPLVTACFYGESDVVAALLEQGANPNQFLEGNWSAIEATFVEGNPARLQIAKMLVDYGGKVDIYGSGTSALFLELQHLMYTSPVSAEEHHISEESIIFLLQHGASTTDEKGNTILHYLASCDEVEILEKAIISRENLINHSNDLGQSALVWAVQNNSLSATRWLLLHGADVQIVDKYGKTALDYAVENGYTDIANLLAKCQ